MQSFDAGLRFHEAGDAPSAIREYRNAIRASPQHAAAYSNLGMLLGADGKRDEAAYHAAVRLAPSNDQIVYNLANALMESSRDAEAEHQYHRVLSLGKRGPAYAPSGHNLALPHTETVLAVAAANQPCTISARRSHVRRRSSCRSEAPRRSIRIWPPPGYSLATISSSPRTLSARCAPRSTRRRAMPPPHSLGRAAH